MTHQDLPLIFIIQYQYNSSITESLSCFGWINIEFAQEQHLPKGAIPSSTSAGNLQQDDISGYQEPIQKGDE
jgi:hypothetical protein